MAEFTVKSVMSIIEKPKQNQGDKRQLLPEEVIVVEVQHDGLRAPQNQDIESARASARRLKSALLKSLRRFRTGYLKESSEKADGDAKTRSAELKKEAIDRLKDRFQNAASLTALGQILTDSGVDAEKNKGLAQIVEEISSIEEFNGRVRKGYRADPEKPARLLDSRGESYELVLAALARLPGSVIAGEAELHKLFLTECRNYLREKLKDLNKISDSVEVTSSEEVVKGAGKGLKELLDEKKLAMGEAAKKGGRIVVYCFSVSLGAFGSVLKLGANMFGKSLGLLRHGADFLGFQKVFDWLRSKQTEGEERENNSRRIRLPFNLKIPLFFPAGIKELFDEFFEGFENAIGGANAEKRKSQLGMKPLHEDDDGLFEFREEGGMELDALLKGFSIRGLNSARIRGEKHHFGSTLHNTETWVVTGKDGSLTSLEAFLKECTSKHASGTAPTLKELYPEKLVPNLKESETGSLSSDETEITARIHPGTTLTLPLSPAYSVRSIVFLDWRGRPIESKEGWTIREGIFGSFKVKSPRNAKQICFVVTRKDDQETEVPSEVKHKLRNILPKFTTYLDPEEEIFRKALAALPDQEDRSKLWYLAQERAGFVYTMDPFLTRYQKRAGSARIEAIRGTRMGICDSFAFYLAAELTSMDNPAVVLSGPVVQAEHFQFNPAHSVAAAIDRTGVVELDLTKSAESDDSVSRWNLSHSYRQETLDSLSGDLTNREVMETGEDLHYFLQGENPPWSGHEEKREGALGGSALKKLDRAAQGRVRERPHLWDSGYESSTGLKSKYTGVQALSQKWYLAELYKQAGIEGTIRPMYRYLAERNGIRGPDEKELKDLPASFEALRSFNGDEEVIGYTRRAIFMDGVPKTVQQEAIEWVLAGTAPPDQPKRNPLGFMDWEAALSPGQLPSLVSAETLPAFNESQLKKLAQNLVENIKKVTRSEFSYESSGKWQSEVRSYCSPEDMRHLNAALLAITKEIRSRGIFISHDGVLALADCSLISASYVANKAGSAKSYVPVKECFDTFSFLEEAAGLESGRITLKLLLQHGHRVGTQLEKLRSHMDATGLPFSDLSAAAVSELRLSAGATDNWRCVKYWGDLLGFEIDLKKEAAELTPLIVKSVKGTLSEIDEDKKSGSRINWPDASNPASAIMARISESRQSLLWRECNALVSMGAVDENSLGSLWPRTTESEVESFLLQNIIFPYRGLRLREENTVPEYGTPFSECTTVHKELLGDRATSGEVFALADFISPPSNEIDRMFASLKAQKSMAWESFSKQLDSSLSCPAIHSVTERVLKGLDREDAYHACLWLGCRRIGRSADNSGAPIFESLPADVGKLRKAIEAGPEQLSALIRGMEPPQISGARVLADIPDRAKAALLAVASLALTSEASYVKYGAGVLPDAVATALSKYIHDDGKNRLVQLWSAIAGGSGSEDLTVSYESARKRVENATRDSSPKFSAPYSRYLLSEKAPVLPRSLSGDFEEYHEYKTGDDVRRIDWKASARADRMLTRKYREQEYRPVKLIVDPEWLYESFDSDGRPTAEFNHLLAEELFTHLMLAEMEGVPTDLVILSRYGTKVFEGLDRSGELKKEDFQEAFSDFLSKLNSTLKAERPIYGDQTGPGYNLFLNVAEFSKGDLLVCGLSRANLSCAQSALGALKAKGCFLHFLHGAGGRTESEKKRENALRDKIQQKKKEEKEKEERERRRRHW